MRKAAVALLLISFAVLPASGTDTALSARLRSEVAAALAKIGLRPSDLVVRDIEALTKNAKRWRESGTWQGDWPMPKDSEPMRPALVDRALRRPLEAMSIGVDFAQGRAPAELRFLLSGYRGGTPEFRPKTVAELVKFLRGSMENLERRVRDVIPLAASEAIPVDWLTQEITPDSLTSARRFFDRYAQVDFRCLALEGRAFAELLLRLDVSAITDWPKERPLVIPAGDHDIYVGTRGPDIFDRDAWLIIDPGGNDIYRLGAGTGSTMTRTGCVLDVEGWDRYLGQAGTGTFGMGILVDRTGEDTYVGHEITQGAALFGVGILLDGGGSDRFVADRFAQGAAAFGYALLRNEGPEPDTYVIQQWGQGFGRTAGTGILEDAGGDDRYVAGTKYPSEMYSQWTGGRKVHWSFAQGCGFGYYGRFQTPDGKLVTKEMFPGGVGLLLDHAGDDSYDASMYGQGTAYFYGLGMLIDRAGNDRYRATWYGQGAAPHYAAGILVDAAGDDVYEGMHQVQGNGRDFSTGVFVDLAGNDRYYGEDRVQGCGDLADGYGLFVDLAGNDVYEAKRRTARGFATEKRPERQPKPGRPYHDVGVFLDLGGKDEYRGKAKGADGTTWIQRATRRGVGVDR